MLQNNQIGAKTPNTGTPSSVPPGITKVIIANNAISNPSNVPNTSKPANILSAVGSQSILLASPTKTLAIPKNIIVSGTQQIAKPAVGTPNKQAFYVLSPVKAAPKVATVLPSVKSPKHRPIAPATISFSTLVATKVTTTTSSVTTATVAFPKTVQQSPTKLILKPVVSTVSASVPSTTTVPSNVGVLPVTSTHTSTNASGAQVQLSGNKVHYVRLVSAPPAAPAAATTTAATVVTKPAILPVATTRTIISTVPVSAPLTTASGDGQIRLGVAVSSVAAGLKQSQNKTVQKILFPAPSVAQVASAKPSTLQLGQVSQIPAGTIIPLGGTAQGYVVVPANYIGQPPVQTTVAQVVIKNLQNSNVQSAGGVASVAAAAASSSVASADVHHSNLRPITISTSTTGNIPSYVPIAPSGSVNVVSPAVQVSPPAATPPSQYFSDHMSESRPRKPCNCTKSQCLKLYCECFAKGEFCNACNCINCYNNLAHEVERQKAIKACRDRNPLAFRPKIGKSQGSEQERRHTKGCNCKRSGCLKNYCECYEAKILCTNLCRCFGCKNFEDSSEKKTLLHLADAAEVRVKQQAAAKANLSSQIINMPSKPSLGARTSGQLPVTFINDDVIQKTILCMLAQARSAEEQFMNEAETEKLLMEEFGYCLRSLITHSEQTADSDSDADLND